MDNGGITPVMPIGNGYGDGFGMGGGGFWIFALLILAMMGGNGFGFGNNFANAIGYENLATSNEVQRGFDNQNLQAQTRDILAAVNAGTAQSVAATNQTFHDNLSAMQSLYNETARDIAGLAVGQANALANQNQCCCETKMLIAETNAGLSAQIAQNKYENALALAGMEQRITAKMDANEIQSLRDQISALQLAQATSSVVRYPTSTVYSSGCNPFCNCGCGCGSI